MTTKSNLQEYLKKYTSAGKEGKKKKIRKKKAKSNIRIIDDNVDFHPVGSSNAFEKNESSDGDEIPTVAEVIDDRPEDVKAAEAFSRDKWKRLGVEGPGRTRHDSSSSEGTDPPPPRPSGQNRRRRPSPRHAPAPTAARAAARHDSDSDLSPPRTPAGAGDAAAATAARLTSMHRARRGSSSDLSPPRVQKSPMANDSDASPPRRRVKVEARGGSAGSDLSPERSSAGAAGRKMSKTLSGATAGLSTAGEMRAEAARLTERERREFQQLDDETIGRHAKTVFRDKESGRRRDMERERADEAQKAQREAAKKAQFDRWGKGLVQQAERDRAVEDALHEAAKPLARYRDDADLDALLRDRIRADDPMAAFVRGRQARKREAAAPGGAASAAAKPQYRDRMIGQEEAKRSNQLVNSAAADEHNGGPMTAANESVAIVPVGGPPVGVQLVSRLVPWSPTQEQKRLVGQAYTLCITFVCYTLYHLSRRPITIVKNVLHKPNCTESDDDTCGFPPFEHDNYKELFGGLDYAFLFAYAVGMFFSGHVAERMDLRYFLAGGMVFSGVFTSALGFAYYWQIHKYTYFLVFQVFCGLFESTGWPAVVACMGSWFGKGRRGFLMGIWTSHTSLGNILGSLVAGVWVDHNWGLSFFVPGLMIAVGGVFLLFFLIPTPAHIGLPPPADRNPPVTPPAPPPPSSHVSSSSRGSEYESLLSHDESDAENGAALDCDGSAGAAPTRAISIGHALRIPGVLEFSACLFFAKLVSYTFLYWLPKYIHDSNPRTSSETAADLSALMDVGGIFGAIIAGYVTDVTNCGASVCMIMLLIAAPTMWAYSAYGAYSTFTMIGLLIAIGVVVNGPYALITTAISADLGTHPSLRGNAKALATVSAIIDGTGSMGAALGPLICGWIPEWRDVFIMLIVSDLLACAVSAWVAARRECPEGGARRLAAQGVEWIALGLLALLAMHAIGVRHAGTDLGSWNVQFFMPFLGFFLLSVYASYRLVRVVL